MAEAYGKLTGRPGICLVTRGPGATHASVGVHTAFQDSTPMLLLVGQVARDTIGREGFQEVDYRQMFGGLAKWVTQVDETARLPEVIARAWRTAMLGAARGRSCSRCRRTCSPRPPTCPTPRPSRSPPRRPRPRTSRAPRELLDERRAPADRRRRGRLDRAGGRRRGRLRRGRGHPGRRVVPLPGLRRQRRARSTPGTPAWRWRPRSRRASPRPTCCSRSAGGWARSRRRATRCWTSRARASAWSTSIPIPPSSAPSTSPSWRSSSGLERFAAALAAAPAGPGRDDGRAAHAEYERNMLEHRELPGRAAARRRHGRRCASACGDDAILTCGAGNFTVWAHRFYAFRQLPDAARAAQRERWATASRPRSPRRPRTPSATSSAWPATATS